MRVFQLIYGPVKSSLIESSLESVKKVYPQVEVYEFPVVEQPVVESDKKRVEILSQHDDILYIDWDVELYEPFVFDSGNDRPYFEFFNGSPDHSVVYSPSREFWKEFESVRIGRNISKEVFGWPRKILRDMKVNGIRGNYKHYRFTTRRGNAERTYEK